MMNPREKDSNPGEQPAGRLPYPDLPVRSEPPRGPDRRDPLERPRAMPQPPASLGTKQTVLDRQSTFNGSYRSESDFLIEGTFEGEIDCKGTVTVAEGANLSATIQARNVVVAGAANGEVTCQERFTILSTGEMRGKAQAATLLVEEGAFFEGEFKMGGNSAPGGFSSWQERKSHNGRNLSTPEAETSKAGEGE